MFFWIYILPSVLISPIITLSMTSLFSMWIMLEFNMMAFLPFIIINNKFYNEVSIKYFIVQTISSSMFILFSNMLSFNLYSIMNSNNNFNMMLINIITISLIIKIGCPPFHNWFINFMNNLNWINCLMLTTWQKIIPLIIICYLHNKKLILLISLISCIFGSIYGLNHQSLRLILSYSSISHISWMLINIFISESILLIYFLSYLMINMSIMTLFNKLKVYEINTLFMLNLNNWMKFLLILNMFSISSLPPLFGFTIKWYSIYFYILNNYFMITMLMMFFSILSFIYYTRICLIFLMETSLSQKMSLTQKLIMMSNSSMTFIFICSSFMHPWILILFLI